MRKTEMKFDENTELSGNLEFGKKLQYILSMILLVEEFRRRAVQ